MDRGTFRRRNILLVATMQRQCYNTFVFKLPLHCCLVGGEINEQCNGCN